MTAVGFEPTQLALVQLESTPLDHSGKLSWNCVHFKARPGDSENFGRAVVLGQTGHIQIPRPVLESLGGVVVDQASHSDKHRPGLVWALLLRCRLRMQSIDSCGI